MAKDYKINEGNMIGAMPAEYDEKTNLQQKVLKASADVKKGQVVVISGDMEVAPASAASAAVLGVAMFDAKEGDPVSVETEGLFRLTASGAITAGAQVESAADGKVATKGDTVTKVIGIALNTASDGGEVFVKFSI
jgi:predicted RecA/RadA family phage recombinase